MIEHFGKLEAAKYLTEDSDEYRAIVRFFLLQHRSAHNHYVDSTAVWQYVREKFAGYTMEKCQQHLDQLREWGCIRMLPRRARPRDVADARRRPKIFQIEEVCIKLEEARLAHELERAPRLNPSALDDMVRSLSDLIQLMASLQSPVTTSDQERVYRLWYSVFRSLEAFARSADGYMAGLTRYQPKTVDLERYEEYRNRIRSYLTDYIRRLFEQRDQARDLLQQLSLVKGLLTDCCAAQEQRAVAADAVIEDRDALVERYEKQIEGLLRYFAKQTGTVHASDVDILLEQASGFIVEITDHVKRLSNQQRGGNIHEQMLLTLARNFADTPSAEVARAEWLAQVAFGATLPLHYKGEVPPSTDQPAWQVPPAEVLLHTVRRGSRQRTRPDVTQDRSVEEATQLAAQREERQRKVQELEELFGPSGILELLLLHLVAPVQRTKVLDLIRRAEAGGGVASVGYSDWQVVLEPLANPTGAITATDGYLYRKPYVLRLQKGRVVR